ncbi:MAG: protein translocase subunit SecD [Streptosporangiales bacterium]|nr:protein translocase subunit SecD [Streptosporangiales bacterium]
MLVALGFGGIVAKAELGSGQYTPKLGLDLAGGTTVTLDAVTQSGKPAPQSQINQAVNIIRQRVNGLGVAEANVSAQGSSIVVQVPGQGQNEVVNQVGQTAKLYFRQVLFAAPGQAQPTSSPTPTASSSKQPGKSSSTPRASLRPTNSPSGRALSKALEAHGTSAHAAPSNAAAPSGQPTSLPTSLPTGLQQQQQQQPDLSGIPQATLKKFAALDCDKHNRAGGQLEDPKQQVVVCGKDDGQKYILGPAKVFGTQVSKAEAVTDPQQFGQWKVNLSFNNAGTKAFGQLTTAASKQQGARNQIAIELDHLVVSAPGIQQGPILGGTAEITGNFTQTEAQDLANVLKYGALPLEFKKNAIQSVSPTLGRDQLNGGLLAGAVGLALVILYVFLYYRGLGMVSVLSLACSALLTYGSVVLLSEFVGYRLSLAGIAGLIVAIGITADSFIVYFERLRDEVREGKTLRQATERSWVRARRTILTADTVSFLAALVLYLVSVDQVKGFAFTLGLTTLIDIVVVFLFTKPMMTLLVRTSFFGGGHVLSGLDPGRLGASNVTRAVSRTAVRSTS